MRRIRILITIVTILSLTVEARKTNLTLTYSQPSEKWIGALPLGNGRLGAMVYGGTDVETIALNEVTLWSGQPDPEANNLCGPEKLKEIREAFLSGDYKRGNELGWQNLCGHGKSFGTHLPFGDIVIKAKTIKPRTFGYSRSLSLDEAIARVSFLQEGITYRREYFTSNPAQALIIRYTASRKQAISTTISMNMLRYSTITASTTSPCQGELDIVGDARFDKNGEGGVRFRGLIRVHTKGGSLHADGDNLVVEGADAMIIVADIRTDFQNINYRQQCLQTVNAASAQSYNSLKAAHIKDYQHLFNRMQIQLGTDDTHTDLTNTDALFANAQAGKANPVFDTLFFQYGRYMQISSSRENSPLPSNLQGIWNDNLACNMPWTCDYHLDINIQQNYWSTNIANLAECNTPLFTYLWLLAKYGSVSSYY